MIAKIEVDIKNKKVYRNGIYIGELKEATLYPDGHITFTLISEPFMQEDYKETGILVNKNTGLTPNFTT